MKNLSDYRGGTVAFCLKCGEELPEGARFCPNCGTGVRKAAKRPAKVSLPSWEREKLKIELGLRDASSIKKQGIIVMVSGLIIFGIIIAVVLWSVSARIPIPEARAREFLTIGTIIALIAAGGGMGLYIYGCIRENKIKESI